MALIKCPDCGKMVSDRAQNCPDCGFPIQEEVQRLNDITNIESNDVSGEYNNLTEKEVAKKLCEAISKKQFADINVFQSILKNKFAEGYYAKIVEDSRDFSDDETEKNQYIIKNIELILDYLDYPLDAMGIRNWFVNKEDRKGKGFFQSDVDSFDDFSKYYINCDACEVIDLRDIMSKIIRSSRFTTRCVISSKSRYVVILKKNANDYNNLVELSKKFIDAYDSDVKVASSGALADSINSGDTVKLFEEGYERTVIDYVEMEKQMLHAVAQQLTFTSNVKQPITSVGTKTVAGALLAGPAGALVGYAVGKDKNAKFERSRQYNEEIRREQEEGRKTLNNLKYGDKPTKNIMLTRSYLGIMTFAGTLPFYVDSYYRGQEGWKVTICGLVNAEEDRCNEFALEKIPSNMKTQIETRRQLARLYFEKGIVFPKTSFVEANISKLLKNPNIAEIALEELSKYDSVQFENYTEEHYREEIEKIKDIKSSVIGNTDVCKVADLQIAKIEDSIKSIKQEEIEKEYQRIKYQGETASEEKLKELIKRIEKIGNYKDSFELKKLYQNKIIEYEKERKQKEEQIVKQQLIKRKKQNRTIISISIVAAITIVICITIFKVIPENKYNKAVSLYNDKKYDDAVVIFSQIQNHNDAMAWIDKCDEEKTKDIYEKATDAFDKGNYEEAKGLFEQIKGYQESDTYIENCINFPKWEAIYTEAIELYNNNQYEEAQAKFEQITDYKDSAILDSKCIEKISELEKEKQQEEDYQLAYELYEKNEYEEAYPLFVKLGDYRDSQEKKTICYELVARERLKNLQVGDTVNFGEYQGYPTYWQVLRVNGNNLTLISKDMLGIKPNDPSVSKDDWNYGYSWDNCYVHKWLDTFLSDFEYDKAIKVSDKVEILSKQEYENYRSFLIDTVYSGKSKHWFLRDIIPGNYALDTKMLAVLVKKSWQGNTGDVVEVPITTGGGICPVITIDISGIK